MKLTDEQRAAISHVHGYADIVAGPGTGKTEVIVRRAQNLYRVVSRPDRVLCVTFSVDAANEMRRRISALTGYSEKALRESVSTFHSLALRLLRSEGIVSYSSDAVLLRYQQESILRDIARDLGIAYDSGWIGAISSCHRKLDRIEDATAGESPLSRVYAEYGSRLAISKCIDFDSMVYRCVRAMSSDRELQERWQSRYAFVIVDEAHDLSLDQYSFAQMLALPEGNMQMVFDPSQSIYSFRGAYPKILTESPTAQIFYLSQNHRSCPEIVASFLPFAESDALSVELTRNTRSCRKERGVVCVRDFADEWAECSAVASEMYRAPSSQSSAVLARTRAALAPYCEAFIGAGISYSWRGKSFWQERDISSAVGFCGFAAALLRGENGYGYFEIAYSCGSGPFRFLSSLLIRQIAGRAQENNICPMELESVYMPKMSQFQRDRWISAHGAMLGILGMREQKPQEFLRSVQLITGLGMYLRQDESPDDFGAENFEALIRIASRFENLEMFVAYCKAAEERERSNNSPQVTLATIHASKGLEWDRVFLVDAGSDKVPHPRASNLDEERRLMYVALSRARDYLWVSHTGAPSIFVETLRKTISLQKAGAA